MGDCDHSVNYAGLCALCGADLTKLDESGNRLDQRTAIPITHENAMIYVSLQEADRLEQETAKRLLSSRKLSLILDLDQTVLHATVNPSLEKILDSPEWKDTPIRQDIFSFTLHDSPGLYHVKLRPGLKSFLEFVNELFELHIYTMGTRSYAEAISRHIDPDGKLFKERILSRNESGSFTKKSIQRLFPCDDSMVVILDDRADVWEWSSSLIKVRPYRFFIDTGDINDPALLAKKKQSFYSLPPKLAGGDTSEVSGTENDSPVPFIADEKDDELLILTERLKELHTSFYGAFETDIVPNLQERKKRNVDVKKILSTMKTNVFKGVKIAFSSVIPLGEIPEKSEPWKLAEMFGATCLKYVSDQCTHLVAGKSGTDKVRKAQFIQQKPNSNLWIVSPQWFYDSIHNWKRQDEFKYVLDLDSPPLKQGDRIMDDYSRPQSTDLYESTLIPAASSELFIEHDYLEELTKEIEGELNGEETGSSSEYSVTPSESNESPKRNLEDFGAEIDADFDKSSTVYSDKETKHKRKKQKKSSHKPRTKSPLRNVAFDEASSRFTAASDNASFSEGEAQYDLEQLEAELDIEDW